MSYFSSIVDSIFGDGSSDSAISGIKDYTGINLDFGLGSTSTNTDSKTEDSSFLSDTFTPKNILGGLSVYSSLAGKTDPNEALAAKNTQELAILDKKFEQDKALLALKAALGGGGGGGGGGDSTGQQIAYDKQKQRYLGVQEAMRNRSAAAIQSNQNLIDSIKNLTNAAQAPLIR